MEHFTPLAFIPLLPALGALFNGIFGARLPKRLVGLIAVGAMALAFLFTVMCVSALHGTGIEDHGHTLYSPLRYTAWTWFEAGALSVDFAFVFDPLSAVMALIITGVGTLIHVYSLGYMEHDRSFWRFFTYLNFFVFAMLCLVLGDNLLVLFLGWEGVGVASYLLIGFWYEDDEKASAGKKAFITNRVGDFAVLIGLFLLYQLVGSFAFVDIHAWASHISEAQLIADGSLTSFGWILTAICLLFFIGCTGKSAQIPLYVWLPDAMAGPTPVSALIHAATMVTAGVYLIARMSFLFSLAPLALSIIALVGGLTALMAATIGITQFDIKKVLAYSTVSQLGYMFLAVGSGSFFAGVFHLMTHAFFKALLFLGSGSVIHGMHEEQDIRKMGGLKKWMPITHITFLIGCLAIAGFPLFSGFFSKDEILWFALSNQHVLHAQLGGFFGSGAFSWLVWFLGTATAAMTAFYMFRLYFLTFQGECRADEHTRAHIHESPATMTFPLVVLAGLSLVGGLVGVPHILGGPWIPAWWGDMHGWLYQVIGYGEGLYVNRFGGDGMAWLSMGVAIAGMAAGIFAAYTLYAKPSETPRRVSESLGRLYTAVYNKYYVDEIYQATVGRGVRWAGVFSHRVIDVFLIDTVLVNGTAYAARFLGTVLRQFQSGDVQRYAAYVLIALGVIVYLLV